MLEQAEFAKNRETIACLHRVCCNYISSYYSNIHRKRNWSVCHIQTLSMMP